VRNASSSSQNVIGVSGFVRYIEAGLEARFLASTLEVLLDTRGDS
jgi:hypothetical protein